MYRPKRISTGSLFLAPSVDFIIQSLYWCRHALANWGYIDRQKSFASLFSVLKTVRMLHAVQYTVHTVEHRFNQINGFRFTRALNWNFFLLKQPVAIFAILCSLKWFKVRSQVAFRFGPASFEVDRFIWQRNLVTGWTIRPILISEIFRFNPSRQEESKTEFNGSQLINRKSKF